MPRTQPSSSILRPLTPVSEADSDTTEATTSTVIHDSSSSATSSGGNSTTEQQRARTRAVNFSRPGRVALRLKSKPQHDRCTASPSTSAILTRVSGPRHYRPASPPLPDEPSFDLSTSPQEHNKETSYKLPVLSGKHKRKDRQANKEINVVAEEFEWQLHLVDMQPGKSDAGYEEHPFEPRIPSHRTRSQPLITTQCNSGATRLKYTSESIPEAEAEEDEWDGEDAKSHHTVSEAGDMDHINSIERTPSWQSSTHDASTLTPKQLKKLRKKGISPALHLEMKAAREGKRKWINPLLGNTYLS